MQTAPNRARPAALRCLVVGVAGVTCAAAAILLQPFAAVHLFPSHPVMARPAPGPAPEARATEMPPDPARAARLVAPPKPASAAMPGEAADLSVSISGSLPSANFPPSPSTAAAVPTPPATAQPAPAGAKAPAPARPDAPGVAALVATVPHPAPAAAAAPLGPPPAQREPLPLQTDVIEPPASPDAGHESATPMHNTTATGRHG